MGVTMSDRTFSSADAHGGEWLSDHEGGKNIGLVLIEYQNEFATEGGKLHDAVKECMEKTNMLANSVAAAEAVRAHGGKVIHCPISFAADGSDNPNRNLGILKHLKDGEMFVEGTWGAQITD